jgi:hypothetical protein
LPAFVDPTLTAEKARPVWLPETGAARLCLRSTPCSVPIAHPPNLLVPALPNVEHILLDTIGRQHVILRSGCTSLQIAISGQDGIIAPAAFAVELHQRRDIDTIAEALAALKALLAARPRPEGTPPRWTADTERLRDALIALDCHRAGATLRDTAVIIYGRKRIDRDWPGTGLRIRMHRNLHRGMALCNGGYRDLLR